MKVKATLQQDLKALLEQRDKMQKYLFLIEDGKKNVARIEEELKEIKQIIKEVMLDLGY